MDITHPQRYRLILFLVITAVLLLSCTPSVFGTLAGTVSIGPLTPVERVGVPTQTPPPQVYTSRGLDIYRSDGSTLFRQINFMADGTFSTELPVGTYVIALTPNGIDHANGLPATLTIKTGKITTITIEIDTGIR